MTSSFVLPSYRNKCKYFKENTATYEQFIADILDENEIDSLLEKGYRHFGKYFYRPICKECHLCIPMRIPLNNYQFPKHKKKIFCKCRNLTVKLSKPEPTEESFQIHQSHRQRFDGQTDIITYDDYLSRFFCKVPYNFQLSVYDKEKLVGVSHIDITHKSMSIVFSYFDLLYEKFGLGTFMILKEIEFALSRGIQYYYMGNYVKDVNHLDYKIRFKPSQFLSEEEKWLDYKDVKGNIIWEEALAGFEPKEFLTTKR